WIVPRRDDADDALRLRDDAIAARREQDRDITTLRPHPLAKPLPHVADAVDAREELRHHRFLGGAEAEAGVDRLVECGHIVDQDALELPEILLTLLVARVGVSRVRLALQLEDALRLVVRDLDLPKLCRLCHRALRRVLFGRYSRKRPAGARRASGSGGRQ